MGIQIYIDGVEHAYFDEEHKPQLQGEVVSLVEYVSALRKRFNRSIITWTECTAEVSCQ